MESILKELITSCMHTLDSDNRYSIQQFEHIAGQGHTAALMQILRKAELEREKGADKNTSQVSHRAP